MYEELQRNECSTDGALLIYYREKGSVRQLK